MDGLVDHSPPPPSPSPSPHTAWEARQVLASISGFSQFPDQNGYFPNVLGTAVPQMLHTHTYCQQSTDTDAVAKVKTK